MSIWEKQLNPPLFFSVSMTGMDRIHTDPRLLGIFNGPIRGETNLHQTFQVPKMEVLNLIRLPEMFGEIYYFHFWILL